MSPRPGGDRPPAQEVGAARPPPERHRALGLERTLQVHPSLRCNLTCRHCYTSSSPQGAAGLDPDAVLAVVAFAAEQGYRYVAVSGGEPVLWPGLPALLDAARSAGLVARFTTNATILSERRVARFAGRVDTVAVSIDGPRETHDELRGDGAYARALAGLKLLRAAGVPYGFSWGLRAGRVHELADVLALARDEGARFVQVHPLEAVGAGAALGAEVPTGEDLLVAALFAAELCAEAEGGPTVILDAAPGPTVARLAALAAAVPEGVTDARTLADLADPLILRPDGRILPGNWALPASFDVADLRAGDLGAQLRRWRAGPGSERWRALAAATVGRLAEEEGMVNLGAELLRTWVAEGAAA